MNDKISDSTRRSLNSVEKIVIVFVLACMLFGIAAAAINKIWFVQTYVVEDGFIEWTTELPLAIICITAVYYLVRLTARKKNIWFFLTYLMIALGSFFVFGEEISWGQRIFHFKTTEYFEKHNSQDEMNIHNLILDGIRVNKLVFSQLLIAGAIVYLIVFPILYKRNQRFKLFIDKSAFPIARIYQVIGCIMVFILSFLTFDPKGAELLEFGGCFMFMLIVLYPQNKRALS